MREQVLRALEHHRMQMADLELKVFRLRAQAARCESLADAAETDRVLHQGVIDQLEELLRQEE